MQYFLYLFQSSFKLSVSGSLLGLFVSEDRFRRLFSGPALIDPDSVDISSSRRQRSVLGTKAGPAGERVCWRRPPPGGAAGNLAPILRRGAVARRVRSGERSGRTESRKNRRPEGILPHLFGGVRTKSICEFICADV